MFAHLSNNIKDIKGVVELLKSSNVLTESQLSQVIAAAYTEEVQSAEAISR